MLKQLYAEIKNSPKGKKVNELESFKKVLEEIVSKYNSLVEEIEKKTGLGVFEKISDPEDIYKYEDIFLSLPGLSEYYEEYLNLTSHLDLLFEMENLNTDEVYIPEEQI